MKVKFEIPCPVIEIKIKKTSKTEGYLEIKETSMGELLGDINRKPRGAL